MPDEPLVSICIPTYNRAGMIAEAIESSLTQSYAPIEVIIVDNASTDNTAEVVAKFTDHRVKYFRNERNLGIFGNYNRCIDLAQGEYIHILHSDDTINSKFTEICMKFFNDHPSVKMTTTSASILTTGSEKIISYADKDHVFIAPEGLKRLLSDRGFIVCPAVIVHRDVYNDVGPYSLEYPYSSDFYQWFKITRKYDVGFVHGAWLKYRQGEHSETFRLMFSSPQGYLDMLRIFIQLQIDLGKDLDQYAAECLAAQRRFIHDCLFAGFTRGDTMPGFSASVFNGLSLTCWTLEKPVSVTQSFGKLQDLAIILSAGLLMSWSPSRRIIRALFFSHRVGY